MNRSLASKNMFGAVRDMAIKSTLKVWSIGISSMLFARFIGEIIGEDFSAITAKTSSLIKAKKSI